MTGAEGTRGFSRVGFNGLRVLSLESRRAEEMATLIAKQGGEPFVAPSMREVPLDQQEEAFHFAERLLNNEFDALILLTGVGTRLLWKTLLTRYSEAELKTALQRLTIVVRGPKPSAAIREIGLVPNVQVPEPNTWHEVLAAMRDRPETRLALQEYGRSNAELIDGLIAQGKEVTQVRIYGWDLPEDTAPLRQAAAKLIAGDFDVVLLTTSTQIVNLMKIAEEEGISKQVVESLRSAFLGSIGPTTSETLEEFGLKADFEPSHPKMGLLVNETAAAVLHSSDRTRALASEEAGARKPQAIIKQLSPVQSSPLNVHLDQYDGPLDLLLDLIRKQQIDIRNIPIATITSQYLAYLDQAREMDLDIGAEFVFMAATLIHIKSRLLLPVDPALQKEGETAEDPREELVQRLLEHQRFKDAAEMLQQKRIIEENVWSNPQMKHFISEDEDPGLAVSLFDLIKAFGEVLERVKTRPVYEVRDEEISIGDMVRHVRSLLDATKTDKPLFILRVMEEQRSRRAMICLFLAVLEMVKSQSVVILQADLFGEIALAKGERFEDTTTIEEEYK
jgi:chromatin segregation and condensation protein Rec8/ScpA/Scc1 (kleisin family)/uroporphyrinogen-III synthase